jgi:hypothetical protein
LNCVGNICAKRQRFALSGLIRSLKGLCQISKRRCCRGLWVLILVFKSIYCWLFSFLLVLICDSLFD